MRSQEVKEDSMDDKIMGEADSNTSTAADKPAGEGTLIKRRVKETVFLATVAGFSILGGFGMTIAMAKKKDPSMFAKGMFPSREIPESGGNLAMRALGWGTFYAVAGVGTFSFIVWKLLGVNNLMEFRQKMGQMLPKIPKKENPGRGDFRTLRELFEFIIEEDEKKKGTKES